MRRRFFQCAALGGVLLLSACSPDSEPSEGGEEAVSPAAGAEDRTIGSAEEREDLDEILARAAERESSAPPATTDPARVGAEPDPSGPPLKPTGIVAPPPFAGNQPGTTTVRVRMDPPLRELGAEWLAGEEGQRDFSMPLPDGSEAVVRVERFVAIGDDGGEFQGTLQDYPDSRVNLSYRGGAEVGTIRIPSENRLIRLMPGSDGEVVMAESEIPTNDPPMPPPGLTIPDAPPPDFIPEPPPGLGRSPQGQP